MGSVAVIPDLDESLTFETAGEALVRTPNRVPMQLPAYLEADLPNARRWWYRTTVHKDPGPAWLRLPVGMHEPRLFLDDKEVDLSPFRSSMELIAPTVAIPDHLEAADEIDVVLRVDVPQSHYDGLGDGTIGLTGGIGVGYPVEEEVILSTTYADGELVVQTSRTTHRLSVDLEHVSTAAGVPA